MNEKDIQKLIDLLKTEGISPETKKAVQDMLNSIRENHKRIAGLIDVALGN